jgi:hypothetical protein
VKIEIKNKLNGSKKEKKEEKEKNNRQRQTAYHPLPFVAS